MQKNKNCISSTTWLHLSACAGLFFVLSQRALQRPGSFFTMCHMSLSLLSLLPRSLFILSFCLRVSRRLPPGHHFPGAAAWQYLSFCRSPWDDIANASATLLAHLSNPGDWDWVVACPCALMRVRRVSGLLGPSLYFSFLPIVFLSLPAYYRPPFFFFSFLFFSFPFFFCLLSYVFCVVFLPSSVSGFWGAVYPFLFSFSRREDSRTMCRQDCKIFPCAS